MANITVEIDYERNRLERFQKIQEKNAQELAMMKEERQKVKDQREKLRQIVIFSLIKLTS